MCSRAVQSVFFRDGGVAGPDRCRQGVIIARNPHSVSPYSRTAHRLQCRSSYENLGGGLCATTSSDEGSRSSSTHVCQPNRHQFNRPIVSRLDGAGGLPAGIEGLLLCSKGASR